VATKVSALNCDPEIKAALADIVTDLATLKAKVAAAVVDLTAVRATANAAAADCTALDTALDAIVTKLNADSGVADTNYASSGTMTSAAAAALTLSAATLVSSS